MTTYSVRIHRAGFADLVELCRCDSTLSAIAVVQALLDSGDENIQHVTVTVRPQTVQHLENPPPEPAPF